MLLVRVHGVARVFVLVCMCVGVFVCAYKQRKIKKLCLARKDIHYTTELNMSHSWIHYTLGTHSEQKKIKDEFSNLFSHRHLISKCDTDKYSYT